MISVWFVPYFLVVLWLLISIHDVSIVRIMNTHIYMHTHPIASAMNTHSQMKRCKTWAPIRVTSKLLSQNLQRALTIVTKMNYATSTNCAFIVYAHITQRHDCVRLNMNSRYMPDQNGPHNTTLCFYQSNLAETFVDHHHVVWGFLSRSRDLLCQRRAYVCVCVCM